VALRLVAMRSVVAQHLLVAEVLLPRKVCWMVLAVHDLPLAGCDSTRPPHYVLVDQTYGSLAATVDVGPRIGRVSEDLEDSARSWWRPYELARTRTTCRKFQIMRNEVPRYAPRRSFDPESFKYEV